MLRACRHGGLALFSNLLKTSSSSCECFLHFSLFSPTPKTAIPHSSSLATQLPQVSPSNAVSSSAVSSISSLISAQTVQCKDFDELLRDYKGKLSSKLVLQILMNYKQLGRVKTLEFYSWAGIQMGFQFDDCVIEYMADFLGRRKLFDDIKCLLLTTLSQKGRLSCRVFSICIRFLGRQGRVAEALSLFQEMETTFRCKPDNIVYNNILYVLCKKETSGELIDIALTIFHRIDVPDTYSYSNILLGLCKFDRLETALQVFNNMNRAGLVPTRSAVNVLIGQMCLLSAKEGATGKVRVKKVSRPFTILVPNVSPNKGAIEPAVSVFWKIRDLGLLPSAFVIVQLMSELCRLGKMEEAFKILKVVEQRKMSCLEEGYSVLVQALCEHNWAEKASFLFGRMLSLGVKPKLVVYNSIICMLSKAGSLDDIERVFKVMNKKRCLPDNVTYTALIHSYSEARNWEAAYNLLIEMLSLGLAPNFHTLTLVDKLLRENGQMDLCFKLEGKLETQILLKHCKTGQLEAAYQKLNSMIGKGLHPPVYVCDAFEQAFQKYGKLKIARELLDKMDKVCKHKEKKNSW
ncbi:protein Rf1, mitochondrial-like [Durio zibethinus]|uniref:Protein Rf1, mitochondrial-like n=1 Tax=Durio zibethinus TaxID=66656 RepID=A0A6P6AN82_DURZI|nr:protein Rf1, mitochondrial-like [Durio zibethinus]